MLRCCSVRVGVTCVHVVAGAAKFVDKQLKSSKGSSESEIEDLLDRVLMLCECWPRWFRLSGW